MRPTLFLAATTLSSILIAQPANAQTTSGPQMPTGHAQPRGPNYTPGSEADRAEQQRLNAEQQQQNRQYDQQLDQRLQICRGC
jgi:hypothetical protein